MEELWFFFPTTSNNTIYLQTNFKSKHKIHRLLSMELTKRLVTLWFFQNLLVHLEKDLAEIYSKNLFSCSLKPMQKNTSCMKSASCRFLLILTGLINWTKYFEYWNDQSNTKKPNEVTNTKGVNMTLISYSFLLLLTFYGSDD